MMDGIGGVDYYKLVKREAAASLHSGVSDERWISSTAFTHTFRSPYLSLLTAVVAVVLRSTPSQILSSIIYSNVRRGQG